MASFQDSLQRSARQLRDLTISQKLAILMGAALVGTSLFWLGQWASTPEMSPLLEQDLQPEEIAAIRAGLDATAEPYQVVGNRVLVGRSANRQALIAQLQQQDRLPADTSIGFLALAKESNPWISQEESNRRWTVAVQAELARVLRQFVGVKQASVFLNLNSRSRSFSRREPPASASVTLVMARGDAVSRSLALAAARLVAGAVRGLPQQNVQVLDGNGAVALDWESEESGSSAALERARREQERVIAEKIRHQLAFDPRVRVNVQVELELTSRDSESDTPTSPVEVSEKRSNEETIRAKRSQQPGVEPNVGLAVSGGGQDERTSVETSEVERVPGRTRKVERTPSGGTSSVSAAVNVSYSYLSSVFSRLNPGSQAPTEAQIQTLFEAEKAKIVNQVAALVKPQDATQVHVDWYYDAVEELGGPGAATQAGSTMDDALQIAQRYAPASGLGVLALASLFLLMRVARKTDAGEAFGIELGLPKEAIEAAQKAARDVEQASRSAKTVPHGAEPFVETVEPSAMVVPMPIGQTAQAPGILEAQEVDESTVRINSMIAQVQEMAEKDAASVAGVLEKWAARKR